MTPAPWRARIVFVSETLRACRRSPTVLTAFKMIRLYDSESGAPLGEITEEQLDFLVDMLEETEESDQDYYIDEPTIDMLEEDDGDPELIALLRGILGDREGLEVRWSDE